MQVPIAGLLDRSYLGARAALIDDARAMATVGPAVRPVRQRRGADGTGPEYGTSHFVVVEGAVTSSP